MLAKLAVLFTFVYLAQAGNEAPPPKIHSYSVPQLAKVAYPAPTVHRTVETYSAPSIEKTTTIVRTITAPINAPAERSVRYHGPGGPEVGVAQQVAHVAPAVQYAPALQFGQAGLEAYSQPIAYQGYQGAFAQAPFAAYSAGIPAYNFGLGHDNLGAVYAAPSFGYSLGQVPAHGVPVAVHQAAAPVAVQSIKEGY